METKTDVIDKILIDHANELIVWKKRAYVAEALLAQQTETDTNGDS